METGAERETSGGASRPSESVKSSTEVMRSIQGFLAHRGLAIARAGVDPAASSGVAGLLKQADRNGMLHNLAAAIRPYGVDVDRWLGWLNGAKSPLLVNGVERASKDPRASSAVLDRNSRQQLRIDARLVTARRVRDEAVAAVEELEEESQMVRATNAAVLEFAIFEHMTKIMNSSLAVGPLWAFVRAVSAVDPDLDPDVSGLSEAERDLRIRLAQTRQEETDLIFQTLDFMCGDPRFESQLRLAILRLIEAVEPQIEARKAAGHKARPLSKIRTTMAASSSEEVIQILGGVPQV